MNPSEHQSPEETSSKSKDLTGPGERRLHARAKEIALINGRDGAPNDLDVEEARRELSGEGSVDEEKDDSTVITRTQDWDDGLATKGRIVAATPIDDEQSVAEQLTQQGVDQAEHETMLQGLKSEINAGGK